METKKINIILIFLLFISIILNTFLIIKYNFNNVEKINDSNEYENNKVKITATFLIQYPEDSETIYNEKYEKDLSDTFIAIIKSSKNKEIIFSKYGLDIRDKVSIKSTNKFNTMYEITLYSDTKENLVDIGNEILNNFASSIVDAYNVRITIIDNFSNDNILTNK